jgi:5-methylcytosine-specific restriction endonuclease McrA
VRTVPEWIGKNDDEPIPPRVRLRVWDRFGGVCQGKCCRKLRPGDKWQADHKVAIANGGRNAERNLQLLCDWCHGKKTERDVEQKAATYRKRKATLGIKKPRTITRWRNMRGEIVTAPRDRN